MRDWIWVLVARAMPHWTGASPFTTSSGQENSKKKPPDSKITVWQKALRKYEAGSAVLLFVPQLQLIGAILLACTMVGAIIAHLFIIGGSAIPGVILLVIVLTIAYAHRKQLNNLYPRSLSSS